MITTHHRVDSSKRPTSSRASEPVPDSGAKETDISYNSQDSAVMSPSSTRLKVGDGGSVDKAKLSQTIQKKDGAYVYEPSDKRFHAAVSLAAVGKTIDMFESALGKPIQWAFGNGKLGIVADGGEDFNAYYSRDDKNLNFFHGTDPVTKKTVFSADSGEVVSHEAGHAILDGLRPGYFSSWSPDPAGFHESFGDVMGMLTSLQDERVLDKVVEQTGGDLKKPNVLSDTGEELGIAINNVTHRNTTGGDYVRTAINDFKWKDPSTLPDVGGPNELGSEAHSYSRLWTGAVYDVLTGMVKEGMDAGQDAKTALRNAGTELLKMTANHFKTAPHGDFTYREMARSYVDAENKHNGGKHSDLILKVFTDRNILQPGDAENLKSEAGEASSSIFKTQDEATRLVKVSLSGPQYGMFSGAVVETPVDADGALTKDAEVTQRTRDNMQRLIESGRVKYADPGQKLTQKDMFDASGRPYMGVVRWIDGQMTIERTKIAT